MEDVIEKDNKKESMPKKIFEFVLPAVILAVITYLYIFVRYVNNYFSLKEDLLFRSLSWLHMILPIFYLGCVIFFTARQINQYTRSKKNLIFLITSIIVFIYEIIEYFAFVLLTIWV